MPKLAAQFNFDSVAEDQRCYQSDTGRYRNYALGDCFFGVQVNPSYGLLPLSEIPAKAAGFHFYLGASQQSLFESFLESDLPRQTVRLSIGSSSDDLGSGLDYTNLTASLSEASFPRLETLELGVWELLCNSHCLFGRVGQIDALSDVMPKLRRLYLYGNCTLRSPLHLPDLEELALIVDDEVTGVNGGPVDPASLENLLSSELPRLRDLYIDLKIGDEDVCYSVPDALFDSDIFPGLMRFELVGTFRAGDRNRLLASPSLRREGQRISLEMMRDARGDASADT